MFRDGAGGTTNFPRKVCEQALADVVWDETEAAYRRSVALTKRRRLMEERAAYVQAAQLPIDFVKAPLNYDDRA
jgi:hypothetical protein